MVGVTTDTLREHVCAMNAIGIFVNASEASRLLIVRASWSYITVSALKKVRTGHFYASEREGETSYRIAGFGRNMR